MQRTRWGRVVERLAWRARKLSRAGFTLAASLLLMMKGPQRAAHDRGPSLARSGADRLGARLGDSGGLNFAFVDRQRSPSSGGSSFLLWRRCCTRAERDCPAPPI